MNTDRIITSLKNIPVKRTSVFTDMKRRAKRRYRREANRYAKAGVNFIPKIKMSDWDVW